MNQSTIVSITIPSTNASLLSIKLAKQIWISKGFESEWLGSWMSLGFRFPSNTDSHLFQHVSIPRCNTKHRNFKRLQKTKLLTIPFLNAATSFLLIRAFIYLFFITDKATSWAPLLISCWQCTLLTGREFWVKVLSWIHLRIFTSTFLTFMAC